MSYLTADQKAKFADLRAALDGYIKKIVDIPAEINEHTVAIRPWKMGAYAIGDVRMYEDIPYKCVQAHDSTANEAWNPVAAPALWMQYHGTSIVSARPWIAPTGAQDMYKRGETMIWTDGDIYTCLVDTTYSPAEYGQAWEKAK